MSLFLTCKEAKNESQQPLTNVEATNDDTSVKRGKYLVTIVDCNTCHTPNNMTEKGPAPDVTRLLSGYPAKRPMPAYDNDVMTKGVLFYHPDLTASAGPWGISFAANLTPDDTGIGSWNLEQFTVAMRDGKYKGLAESRALLPPMPWQSYTSLTDADIEAIFNYLNGCKGEALPGVGAVLAVFK